MLSAKLSLNRKTLHLAVFRSSLWRVCKLFLTTQKSLKLSVWGFFDNLLEFQKTEKQMPAKPIVDYFRRVWDATLMHATFYSDRMNWKLTNPHILCLRKDQAGPVSPVIFPNILSHTSGFWHVRRFQIFSMYLHRPIFSFLGKSEGLIRQCCIILADVRWRFMQAIFKLNDFQPIGHFTIGKFSLD